MHIVGADDFKIKFLGQLEESGDDLALFGDPVVLDLDEKVLPAEDLHKPAAGPLGLLETVVHQVMGHERGQAAAEADQAVGVLRQGLEIGPRLVVKALQVGVRHQFKKVLIAGEVLRQEAEMEDRLAVIGAAVAFQP